MIEINNKIIYSFLTEPSLEKYNKYIENILNNVSDDEILSLLNKNLILLKFIEKCKSNKIKINDNFYKYKKKEIFRRENIFKFVKKINQIAEINNNEIFFPKLFIHYPDVGNDIDLIITNKNLLNKILKCFSFKEENRTRINKLSSKFNYFINDFNVNLEVHVENIGIFGEFHFLKKKFFSFTQKNKVGDLEINNYNNNNLFMYFIIQRIYSHYSFRISDIIYFKNTFKNSDLKETFFNNTLGAKIVLDTFKYYNYNQQYPKFLLCKNNIDMIRFKFKILLVLELIKKLVYRFEIKSLIKMFIGVLIYIFKK